MEQSILFTSAVTSSPLTDVSTETKNYIKNILRSRIFLGRYIERRLIDQLTEYRDIVVISPAEVDLKRDLINVQHKLRKICPNTLWIGITSTEFIDHNSSGICLWTEIDNQPLGVFWFQIKNVKFREDEVIVHLKCLRHISDAYLEVEPVLTGSTNKVLKCTDRQPNMSALSNNYHEPMYNIKNMLTINNLKDFITFLFACIIAIFTGSTTFLNFLGNFVLGLIREITLLIKNSTPMFLGFLEFLSKIIGGFYILLAMFFRPNNTVSSNKRTLKINPRYSPQYQYDRSFD